MTAAIISIYIGILSINKGF